MLLKNDNIYSDYPGLEQVANAWFLDEKELVMSLAEMAKVSDDSRVRIESKAKDLVLQVRQDRLGKSGLDAFMTKYDLSSDEGIVLMCLAEALLRIPDTYTADKLIRDKLASADWNKHLGESESLFVNAATWSLMLTGKIISPKKSSSAYFTTVMSRFVENRSKPIIRSSVMQGMKILGQQYVMGETINSAIKRARKHERRGYTYSYDMLGEAATTMLDADDYFEAYKSSIISIGRASTDMCERKGAGISVKLSALHPRYESMQSARVHAELYPRLFELMRLAKSYKIGLNIDAEETERLELSLELISRLSREDALSGWSGLGIVVQAYQKRAIYVLNYLIMLAKEVNMRFMVRLVKGAYWDAEIKQSQEQGFNGYPVFTRKCYTDVSYIACAKIMFANSDFIYPQFATHNAHTVATILELASGYKDFEFQCLHGMGDALYDNLVVDSSVGVSCRIYAPVGSHNTLLPYLVRRLLENGANSSFVNRIVDETLAIEDLIEDPVQKAFQFECEPHSRITMPIKLFGETRMNSKGYNVDDRVTIQRLKEEMSEFSFEKKAISSLIYNHNASVRERVESCNPSNNTHVVSISEECEANDVDIAMREASKAFFEWDSLPVANRSNCLIKMADLLEEQMPRFMAIAITEAGKTLHNAIDEVREAIDFCRYYAVQAEADFSSPVSLPGPTGEDNTISLHGRGVIVCISPWNFPLAIFLGQVVAAIAAGNTVVAKPAEQTPLIAYEAVKLLYKAGVPKNVVQLVLGRGDIVGAAMIENKYNAGVIFTGSTEVASIIQRQLASKEGAILPLIAETGGQNVLVADSSSLSEQVVGDVINSAFDSAGQRCSALRVLFLQEDIADSMIEMLIGAMKEIKVGDPQWLENDIGPVIDSKAQENLIKHIDFMSGKGELKYQVILDDTCKDGTYVAPALFEINDISVLNREVFGPILHVVRYKNNELDEVVKQINGAGYGLTFGVHSRIQETIDFLVKRVRAGNIYINRNIVGAVVGVQPFGGQGLSGTGPKAGGPLYLHRLAVERTVSVDSTASGGNASLMAMSE